MKRTDLLKELRKIARANNTTLVTIREGGSHTVMAVGANQFTVPRHNEINEHTARSICKPAGKD